MLELMMAAALAQGEASDPCHAAELATPRPARCPNWLYVQTDDGNRVYVDPASLQHSIAAIEIDTRAVAARSEPSGLRSVVARLRYDCATRTAVALHIKVFDSAGALIVEGPPPPGFSSPPIQANTPIATLFAGYCQAPASREVA
ncbi:MAG TPA: surface-adhesin E family protein [Allosphingosinicella sp.]|nr:surface-adhesin E family protein [Allosphingosinicella sp.]